ncbi:MAG: glycerophosphodiester phosphodiesterase family protein, partial [Dongiaceae bacterium]
WVEFDAKLTGDGVVVLMHDDTLDRTTDGHGAVAETRYADIARLDAGAWFGPAWRGARVPTLAAAVALLDALDLQANIEITPCPGREVATAEAVAGIISDSWPAGRAWPLLSSFSHESLATALRTAPDLPRGLLIWEHPADWAAGARQFACATVHCAEQYLTRQWAAEIRRAGYRLAVYTVNEPARARELRAWDADCIITDRPDTILAAI